MKVSLLTADDLIWKADGSSNDGASYRLGVGMYKREFHVDPYPCYTHELAAVEDLVARCSAAFPLDGAMSVLFVISHELSSRFNGLTYENSEWRRDDGSDLQFTITKPDGTTIESTGQSHVIVLSGKRTPRMPGQTRYIVTHEYGHAAFHHTRRLLGVSEGHEDELEREYLRIRGDGDYKHSKKGQGAYRWHQLASEIIANDFRIAVMNTEADFWPHEVPPPTDAIRQWWVDAAERARNVDSIAKEIVKP